ncbi:MAG: hypothetical protein ABEI06_03215, partial [Halobacteriaceae archaeon]
FAVLRRSKTMMAVLKMRGYPLHGIAKNRSDLKIDGGDILLVGFAFGVLGITLSARFGLLSNAQFLIQIIPL